MDRDAEILLDHISGDPLRTIGDRYGLSHEGARLVIVRQARRHIDTLVTGMWAAQKEGSMLALAVPAGPDADQRFAVQYLDWVLGEMAKRGDVKPRVHYRPSAEGDSFVFALEDTTFNPTNGGDA